MRRLLLLTLCCAVLFAFGCEKQLTVDDVVMKTTQATGGADSLAAITDQVSTWNFAMQMMMPMEAAMEPAEMPAEEMAEEGTEETAGEEMAEEEVAGEEMAEEGEAGEEMAEEGMPAGEMDNMDMVITFKRPNKIRFDFMMPGAAEAVMSSGYDGTVAWEMAHGQIQQKSEMETKMDAEMAATWLDGFQNYKEMGYTLELLPNEMVGEQDCVVLKGTNKDGNVQTYYYDAKTYHLVRQAGDMLNMQKVMEPMYMVFGDYDTANGISGPSYVAQHLADGEMVWEATQKDVKHNTGVQDDVFAAPDMTMK